MRGARATGSGRPAKGRETFPKASRLRNRSEFLALQREGRRRQAPHFVVLLRRRPAPPTRLGITTSRKVGSAPARNRVRRLVREFFRRRCRDLTPPHDILVIARPGAAALAYREVERELARALRLDGPESR